MRRYLLLLLFASVASAAEPTGVGLREEARVATSRGDLDAARRLLTQAAAAQPDSTSLQLDLAAVAALRGDAPAAISTLEKIVALGAAPPVERDPRFATLQGSAPFRRVLQAFSQIREPVGVAEEMASLTGRTGILEGIAWRARTGDLFLGDVRHRDRLAARQVGHRAGHLHHPVQTSAGPSQAFGCLLQEAAGGRLQPKLVLQANG